MKNASPHHSSEKILIKIINYILEYKEMYHNINKMKKNSC